MGNPTGEKLSCGVSILTVVVSGLGGVYEIRGDLGYSCILANRVLADSYNLFLHLGVVMQKAKIIGKVENFAMSQILDQKTEEKRDRMRVASERAASRHIKVVNRRVTHHMDLSGVVV